MNKYTISFKRSDATKESWWSTEIYAIDFENAELVLKEIVKYININFKVEIYLYKVDGLFTGDVLWEDIPIEKVSEINNRPDSHLDNITYMFMLPQANILDDSDYNYLLSELERLELYEFISEAQKIRNENK